MGWIERKEIARIFWQSQIKDPYATELKAQRKEAHKIMLLQQEEEERKRRERAKKDLEDIQSYLGYEKKVERSIPATVIHPSYGCIYIRDLVEVFSKESSASYKDRKKARCQLKLKDVQERIIRLAKRCSGEDRKKLECLMEMF